MRNFINNGRKHLQKYCNLSVFKMTASAILDLQKFEIQRLIRCKAPNYGSSCQILPKSVKRLQRNGDLTDLAKWQVL